MPHIFQIAIVPAPGMMGTWVACVREEMMSLLEAPEEAGNIVETGREPEYWVDRMPKYDLIENTSVRMYCAAAQRNLLLMRYTAIVPRSMLRPFAEMLLMIADMMDRIDKEHAAAMH